MSRRTTEIEDRYYTRSPHVDRSPFGYRAEESFERRRARSPSPERRRVTTTEVVERRSPAFIEEDLIRREREREGGVLVRREVETRRRSPSPAPRGILRSRVRSVSPTRAAEEIERIRREEIIQTRSPRLRSRSRSPSMEARLRNRFDERRRSLEEHERTETRIIERERRMARSPSSSRSSSPSPSPPVIRGPTIEREVVTHYRDIDHGVVQARPQPRFNHVSPPFRHRSVSRERRAPRSEIDLLNSAYDELRITDTTIDDRHSHSHSVSASHRRSHSAAPPMSPADREEAEYITNRIESRGRPGEAKHGVTKQWEIVDVPPGTERVRMDGAGGAGVDIDWTQYSGVRRTRFIPDRDRDVQNDREEDDLYIRRSVTDLAPQVEREREVHIEKVTDRKILRPSPAMPPPPRKPDMWTEITKDLVVRQAIETLGLDYEETDYHFYVMQYLKYEDVLELIELSDDIRRRRRDRAAGWDRVGDWERQHRVRPLRSVGGYDEVDRIIEKKTTYDRAPLRYR